MAFCPNCGAQVPENADFCGSCGKKAGNNVVTGNKVGNTEAIHKARQFIGDNKNNKKFKIALASVVAVIIIAIVVKNNMKAKINLNDYVTVDYSGYDSAGTASVSFDYDKFEKAVASKMKTSKSTQISDDDWDLGTVGGVVSLEAAIDYKLDKSDQLSNGDKITLSWNCEEDAGSDYKIKLVYEEQDFTVDGLEAVKEVDPFEDIDVSFEGVVPNVTVTVKNNSKDDVLSTLYVTSDYQYGDKINVGDKVTVKVDTDADMLLTNYGYKLTETEKKYTCDGVDEYVTTLADVTDDFMTELQAQAQDVLTAYVAQQYEDDITASEWNYEGSYFMMPKSSDSWNDANDIILVYATTVSSISGEHNPVVVYFPVEFSGVIKHADGTEECDLTYSTILGYASNIFNEDTWFGYTSKGYTDTNTMYSEIITSKVDKYTYEVSETLQQYGN